MYASSHSKWLNVGTLPAYSSRVMTWYAIHDKYLYHTPSATMGWGTISYPIRDKFLSEYVFRFFFTVFLYVFSLYFTRISRFAEYTHRIQQNTLYSQEYTRIHTEYAQNTQRAKTPKSALRAIHVLTRQERAKYRRRIRILQNTYFLIVFRAFRACSRVFCCVFTHVQLPSWHAFAWLLCQVRQPSS